LNFKKGFLCFTILLLSVCMIKIADLRLAGPFMGEAIEGGCRIHFSVINLGQRIARDAYIYLETWDQIDERMIAEYKLFLGDIKPGEIRQYQLDLMGIEWGSNIGFRESFIWD